MASGEVERVLLTKDHVRDYYNKIARFYDALAEHSEGPMKELGLAKLAPAPGERILEVGFGTGHTLVEIARAVGDSGQALGVDLSDEMAALTRSELAKEGLLGRAELHTGDAATLPFDDDSVDGVFMSFTLELFDTPEIPVVLAECKRVLRPSGRIAVVAISRESEKDAAVAVYEWTHRHFPNLLDCRPIYVERSLVEAGFAVESAEVRRMWVPVEIVLATSPDGKVAPAPLA